MRAVLLIALALVVAMPAYAGSHLQPGSRVALVIGNADYAHAPSLINPKNDATDVATTLERLGFSVREELDLDYDGLRRALREFSHEASGADIAAIFFAGHGLEVDGQNYLIPVDARLGTDRDVAYEAIPLGHLLRAVEGARTLGLVLLDSCRDNPFIPTMKMASATRSLTRGLTRVEPTGAVLVGFAAREGTVAADGDGRNSPYTAALLKHLETPGLEIRRLFGKVRDEVRASTDGVQEPYVYGSLGGDAIYLVPPAAPISADYAAAERIGTPEAWEAFLAQHGGDANNLYVRLARTNLQEPKGEASLPLPVPPKPTIPTGRKLIYDRIIGEETLEPQSRAPRDQREADSAAELTPATEALTERARKEDVVSLLGPAPDGKLIIDQIIRAETLVPETRAPIDQLEAAALPSAGKGSGVARQASTPTAELGHTYPFISKFLASLGYKPDVVGSGEEAARGDLLLHGASEVAAFAPTALPSNMTEIAKTPPPRPVDETIRLAPGQSLTDRLACARAASPGNRCRIASALVELGVTITAARAMTAAIEPVFPTTLINSGQVFTVALDKQPDFYGNEVVYPVRLSFSPSSGQTIVVEAEADGQFTARLEGEIMEGPDLTARVQMNLKRLGCYQLGIDGVWGAGSRNGLKLYYDTAGEITTTLEPTRQLLSALEQDHRTKCAALDSAGSRQQRASAPADESGSESRESQGNTQMTFSCKSLFKEWQGARSPNGAFAVGEFGKCGFSAGYETMGSATGRALQECRYRGSSCQVVATKTGAPWPNYQPGGGAR